MKKRHNGSSNNEDGDQTKEKQARKTRKEKQARITREEKTSKNNKQEKQEKQEKKSQQEKQQKKSKQTNIAMEKQARITRKDKLLKLQLTRSGHSPQQRGSRGHHTFLLPKGASESLRRNFALAPAGCASYISLRTSWSTSFLNLT